MKINKVLIPFFILFFLLSCSQSTPVLTFTKWCVVFEYNNDELPESRLSMFIEAGENVKRVERLIVSNESSNLSWTIEDLVLLQSADRLFCGYPNFVVQSEDRIPVGRYVITFVQADGTEKQISANVTYDEIFYNSKSQDIPRIMNEKNGSKKIAIYSQENDLLYYGDKKDSVETNEKIAKKYENALYYNEIWSTPNDTVICIMPEIFVREKIYKKTENDKSLEQSKQTESENEQDHSEQQNHSVQNDSEIDQSNNIDKMDGFGIVDEAEAMSVSSV